MHNSATSVESTSELNLRRTGQRIGKRFVTLFMLALAGLWIAALTPAVATLSIRVAELEPDRQVFSLALVVCLGALAAVTANPIFGSHSGRRRPFIVGGFVAGSVAVAGVGVAPSVAAVAVSWVVAQFSFALAAAALVSVLPERVPPHARGRVAGVMGVTPPFGLLVGLLLVEVVGSAGVWMFVVPVVAGVALSAPFALALREEPGDQGLELEPLMIRPVWHPAYAFAWLGRLLVWTSLCLLIGGKRSFLGDRLGYAGGDVVGILPDVTLLLAVSVTVSGVLVGWLSDLIGRRKPLVVAGHALLAAAMLTVGLADGLGVFVLGIALAGLAQGMSLSAGDALASEAGAGSGIPLASVIPLTIAPVLAQLLAALGTAGRDAYTALCVMAAALALVGAAVLQRPEPKGKHSRI